MGRKPLGPWVVAGADGSADALAAVEVAAAEAEMRGLRLRVIATSPRPASACPAPGSDSNGRVGVLAARVGANLAAARAASCAHRVRPNLTVRTMVVATDLAEALIRESRTAGLVVVGGRNSGGDAGPGSVCAHVAARAHCPTVVVSSTMDRTDAAYRAPVVVGVSAAGSDQAAIGFAFEEAQVRGSPLWAVHVWWQLPAGVGCVDPFGYTLRETWAAVDRRLAGALAGWAGRYPQVPVRRLALYDTDRVRALLRVSEHAGLVVLDASRPATHGVGSLGTVADELIRRAGCPVCVVPAAGRWSTPPKQRQRRVPAVPSTLSSNAPPPRV
ncbi:MAG: universal stress protein [Micromonosporaceae bacterium]|nr:universal stress protein [Micromonosporaceae bacterium]